MKTVGRTALAAGLLLLFCGGGSSKVLLVGAAMVAIWFAIGVSRKRTVRQDSQGALAAQATTLARREQVALKRAEEQNEYRREESEALARGRLALTQRGESELLSIEAKPDDIQGNPPCTPRHTFVLFSRSILELENGGVKVHELPNDAIARFFSEGSLDTFKVRDADSVAYGSQGGVQRIAGAESLETSDSRKTTVTVTGAGLHLTFRVDPGRTGVPVTAQFVDAVTLAVNRL